MNQQFVKMIVESFYNDNQTVKSIYPSKKEFVDDIYTEIESILQTCRLEDSKLYFELYTNYDKRQQQKILYSLIEYSLYDRYPDQFLLYENNYDELYDKIVILNESVIAGITIGTLAALILGFLSQTTPFSKLKWSVLSKFQAINEKVHKFIKSNTKSGRVRLAITFNNADECYQKCKIQDKSDLSTFIGGGFRNSQIQNDNPFKFNTTKAKEQAYCLTNCYLNWSLNQISTVATSYVTCLRSTGERGFDMNDISSILNTTPTSEMCDPYKKLLKEHKDAFVDVLDVVCKDSIEEEEYIRRYNQTLNDAFAKAGRINNSENRPKLDKDSFSYKGKK